ncbi:MAG: hypothetical protein ABSC94_31620 [Polyangiaceae bacterium]
MRTIGARAREARRYNAPHATGSFERAGERGKRVIQLRRFNPLRRFNEARGYFR